MALLSSAQVQDQAGITYRQLHYWVTAGYIQPATADRGSGYPRGYDPAEVAVALAMRAAVPLALGRLLTPDEVRQIAAHVRAGHRGRVRVPPGVVLDLATICGDDPTQDRAEDARAG